MIRPPLEVADIIRAHGAKYLKTSGAHCSAEQKRALAELSLCRTAALGGHLEQCDHCGHQRIAYNSCRNRHCPKCQGAERAKWLADRSQELLPVEYFHVVFTLPQALAPLALQNPRLIYGLLFRAASDTLLKIAADPKHLGAAIGFLAVLHTWGQTMGLHPHLHCVVPGGGLSSDGARWVACRKGFFLPVRVLSRLFRRKFLAYLQHAFEHGKLSFFGHLAELTAANRFRQLCSDVANQEWVVYAKPPFGGPDQVLKYLARYTHRVAISNHRLQKMEGEQVTFAWKDYAHHNQEREMTIDAGEFLRRFLLHILPKGFVRIRHYGLLTNRDRGKRLAHCRALLAEALPAVSPLSGSTRADDPTQSQTSCPTCLVGTMVRIGLVPKQETMTLGAAASTIHSS